MSLRLSVNNLACVAQDDSRGSDEIIFLFAALPLAMDGSGGFYFGPQIPRLVFGHSFVDVSPGDTLSFGNTVDFPSSIEFPSFEGGFVEVLVQIIEDDGKSEGPRYIRDWTTAVRTGLPAFAPNAVTPTPSPVGGGPIPTYPPFFLADGRDDLLGQEVFHLPLSEGPLGPVDTRSVIFPNDSARTFERFIINRATPTLRESRDSTFSLTRRYAGDDSIYDLRMTWTEFDLADNRPGPIR